MQLDFLSACVYKMGQINIQLLSVYMMLVGILAIFYIHEGMSFILFLIYYLRKGFTIYNPPRLATNSQRSTCLYFLGTSITAVHHYPPGSVCLLNGTLVP